MRLKLRAKLRSRPSATSAEKLSGNEETTAAAAAAADGSVTSHDLLEASKGNLCSLSIPGRRDANYRRKPFFCGRGCRLVNHPPLRFKDQFHVVFTMFFFLFSFSVFLRFLSLDSALSSPRPASLPDGE